MEEVVKHMVLFYEILLEKSKWNIRFLEHLRHGVLLQSGVNPHETIDFGGIEIPADFTSDLVCQGNYPHLKFIFR